ncbi:tyrosine-type recombinase/integrase [Corynebacterium gottingense]|uniref:tyrosine-type recombinase/integrase n=1 Tax=Corynebacterium gottingense TaxID=2041036 RepID=UPI0038CF8642
MARKARWGSIKKLPSGNYQASYPHPENSDLSMRIKAPHTFGLKEEAETWLAKERALIAHDKWLHPDERAEERAREAEEQAREEAEKAKGLVPFKVYAEKWISTRTNRDGQLLASRTREEYLRYLDDRLAEFADKPLSSITADTVRAWYAEQISTGKKTSVGRQYDFMKSVFKLAVEDELIPSNPCKVKGGSKASTEVEVKAPTDAELQTIIDEMPEDLKHVVLIAAAAGLRWGEIAPLTPEDIEVTLSPETGDVDAVRIAVTRAEVRLQGGKKEVKKPKSKAGVRVVSFFGSDAADVAGHVRTVKPGERLTTRTYAGVRYHWMKAREKAGRPDLHFHALRHYSGTRFAQAGATLKEIMDWLGHSDVNSAMAYQKAVQSRMEELARRAARN